ncbi:MAG: DUF92 domain-containing protein [Anaerolineales bacterium]|nr:DUF92 domain-containing protein [Anaerolineales bacterium]MCW5855332.1 DUF92 domain-containing protein [Anaerolineales bacterium]
MLDVQFGFDTTQILIGSGLAAIIALAGWRLGALNLSGAVAATALGGLTYGLGGLPAAMLLVAFFASSSGLSRAFNRHKKAVSEDFSKTGQRDWVQVLANGGAALLALLAGAMGWLSQPVAWLAFAAALATANADTWATELGVLSRTPPRLVTTGAPAPTGASGAVSALGTLVGLAAGLLIGVLAGWLLGRDLTLVVLVVGFSGLLGSLIDSYLGATVQAGYYCPKCKKETERHPQHTCGATTQLRRGLPWFSNDWVNLLSTFCGAFLASGAATLWL